MLRSLKRAESTTAAVRRILINEAGNLPNLDQVGGKLHMSKSTLKRRLENESTNFRIICDEVRNLLAQKYLTDTELSVEDIAHLLGYTEMTKPPRLLAYEGLVIYKRMVELSGIEPLTSTLPVLRSPS